MRNYLIGVRKRAAALEKNEIKIKMFKKQCRKRDTVQGEDVQPFCTDASSPSILSLVYMIPAL